MRILTNGCFDLFHDGHKDLFEKIFKIFGDQINFFIDLLVLVNSDNSVRQLKGPERPIDNITKRIINIQRFIEKIEKQYIYSSTSFKSTSIKLNIVSFKNEEELKKLINSFNPDIIVKGNDRPDVRDIIGNDKYPVLIIPRIIKDGELISTTNILKKLK
jgi:D-beta-D-heptose 7-phosphate kinase/D-beta-D-heptose 1-phosphate adenosyltransferase